MLPAACLMWPLFVLMSDLKLHFAFRCQMPPNASVAMAAAARSTSRGPEL